MEVIKVKAVEKFSGTVTVPGDKSISHRAAILGSIANGLVHIKGFLCSADCLATLRAVQSLGVNVEGFGTTDVKIHGVGLYGLKESKHTLDLENSGTGVRLLAGLVSGYPFLSELTGDLSLQKRPMMRIIKPLREMGAHIEGEKCPMKIRGGGLRSINYISPIASAQVKSCLLIAGLFGKGITSVTEPSKSRDHTERMLQYLGAEINIDGLKVSVKGGTGFFARPIMVPADISSAAFILAGGAIIPGSCVTVKDVGINPTRMEFLNVLKRMGADLHVSSIHKEEHEPIADISVRHSKLRGVVIEKREIPGLIDELPIIAVLSAFAEGRTVVEGAEELRVKESDRIKSVAVTLSKFGVCITEKEDGWIIDGGKPICGAIVNSFGDHRIAMAMTILGLAVKGGTIVEDTEWINTSFPGFKELIEQLSGQVIG
jgi:3-phosphoshikimate 1-carboxyvinyltransferase